MKAAGSSQEHQHNDSRSDADNRSAVARHAGALTHIYESSTGGASDWASEVDDEPMDASMDDEKTDHGCRACSGSTTSANWS